MHANSRAEFPRKSSSWKRSGFSDQRMRLRVDHNLMHWNDASTAPNHHGAFLFRNTKPLFDRVATNA